MNRDKRTAQVRANIPPELLEDFKEVVAAESNVLSMSDYLFGMIEDRVLAIKVHKQKVGRRIGRQ